MIKNVKLKNFKSFKKVGKIDIGKINVFVGPNSSGKSSFIQGLLLLKNAIQCVVEKQYKNLEGDYKSLVYDKDTKNKIEYKITFDEREKPFLELQENKIIEIFTDIEDDDILKIKKYYSDIRLKSLSVTLKVVDEGMLKTDEFEINTFEVTTKENLKLKVFAEDEKYKIKLNEDIIDNVEVLNTCKFYFKMNQKNLKDVSNKLKDKILLAFSILEKLEKSLIDFSDKLIYMGSLRTDFLRSENIDGSEGSSSVGSRGQRTLSTLKKIDKCCGDDCKVQHKKAKIDHWLDEFDLGDKIEIERTNEGKYSIMIRNKYLDIYSNILDVGIGTAQILPIIIEAVNSKDESLIIVEEPETHIHPKAQAKLADLFVGCVNDDNKKFIIETHSIFLVTQLQILVASGKISEKDVKVYFFDQDEEGTKITDMVLTSNGQFEEEWPSGFFDIHYELGRKLFELI